MMRSPIKILLTVSIAVLVIAVFAAREHNAEQQYVTASDRLSTTLTSARAVVRLRAAEANVTTGAQPAEDVTPLVSRALIDAGLPSSSLRSISPASSSASRARSSNNGLRTQSVKITLKEVAPPDLGRFLSSWRRSQHIWTPTQIELHHPPTFPTSRSDNNNQWEIDIGGYTVHITLTGYYLDDAV